MTHPDTSTIIWPFELGDTVRYNHGGETWLVTSRRVTQNLCTADRLEYCLEGTSQFWAEASLVTKETTP